MGSEMRDRIKAARRHAELTQERLGEICGVSKSAVSNWETNNQDKATRPTIDNLKTVAAATGAPIEWLMDDNADLAGDWEERVKWAEVVELRQNQHRHTKQVVAPNITEDERSLIDAYRTLSDQQKREASAMIESMADTARNELMKDPRIAALITKLQK